MRYQLIYLYIYIYIADAMLVFVRNRQLDCVVLVVGGVKNLIVAKEMMITMVR